MAKKRRGRPFSFNMREGLEKILEAIEPNWQIVNGKKKNINAGMIQHFKTISHCCAFLKINNDTWYDHLKRADKIYSKSDAKYISDAIKTLDTLRQVWWVDIGLAGKVNATAWVFCQKNIFGWRDKREISGPDGAPITSQVIITMPDNGRKVN